MRYLHTLVIVSEYDDFEDIEAVARDANRGDSILRSWTKETAPIDTLTEAELDFFLIRDDARLLRKHES